MKKIYIVCIVTVIISLFFRLFMLGSTPLGIVPIESSIILAALNAIRDKAFYLLASGPTHWEMLGGYLFNILINTPRYVSAIIGIIEVLLFFIYFKRISFRFALLSALFLLISPWHIYYSRILGICQNINFFFMLSLIFSDNLIVSYFVNISGLLYYTTYRMVMVRAFIQSLLSKKYKYIVVQVLSGLTILLLIVFSRNTILEFITRGGNQIPAKFSTIFNNYLYALIFPFVPIFSYYHKLPANADGLAESGAHEGLSTSIYPFPPLALISILAILGIITFIRKKNHPKYSYLFLSNYIILWVLGGFAGPSFGRFVLYIPTVIYFAVLFVDQFFSQKKIYYTLILVTILSTLTLDLKMFLNLRSNKQMAPYFLPYVAKISEFLKEEKEEYKFIVMAFPQDSSNFYAETTNSHTPIYGYLDPRIMAREITDAKRSLVVFPEIPKNYKRLFVIEEQFAGTVKSEIFKCSQILERGELLDDPDNSSFDNNLLGTYFLIDSSNC